ncbi:MAG TPA: hypothetical protein VLA19_20115 [Herpetosiphonaceae bacterium]|nr:hypothetical protein [Herpetosiphonaceae bacterium]
MRRRDDDYDSNPDDRDDFDVGEDAYDAEDWYEREDADAPGAAEDELSTALDEQHADLLDYLGSRPGRVHAAHQIQRDIGDLRTQLRGAYRRNDQAGIRHIRERLLAKRLAFCSALRPRSPEEVAELRASYLQQMQHEYGAIEAYRSACWACATPVDSATNDYCGGCGWLICACGACQCPGKYNFVTRDHSECHKQPLLLGAENYRRLAEPVRWKAGTKVDDAAIDDLPF